MANDLTLSAEIVGGERLAKAFDNMGAVALRELSQALNKTAVDITADAKILAPHLHGFLRDSIHTEYAQPVQNMEAKVGTNIVYAKAQEYGTVGMTIHSHSKLGKPFTYTGNIPAKHYMKQAKDNGKPRLTSNLEVALRNITRSLAV